MRSSVLIGAFNEMLAQIQQRDAALLEAHDELDAKVKERTAELKLAEENLRVLSSGCSSCKTRRDATFPASCTIARDNPSRPWE